MTDHKFTDDEVIKALECCRTIDGDDCSTCPYRNKIYELGLGGCVNDLVTDALALINRQKAEIERLESLTERLGNDVDVKLKYIYELEEQLKTAKSEAIKEFAERLIEKCDAPHWCVWMSEIEDLAKEMTEEQTNES